MTIDITPVGSDILVTDVGHAWSYDEYPMPLTQPEVDTLLSFNPPRKLDYDWQNRNRPTWVEQVRAMAKAGFLHFDYQGHVDGYLVRLTPIGETALRRTWDAAAPAPAPNRYLEEALF